MVIKQSYTTNIAVKCGKCGVGWLVGWLVNVCSIFSHTQYPISELIQSINQSISALFIYNYGH